MSTEPRFDRHALDDGQAHAAHLKVGGLETPCKELNDLICIHHTDKEREALVRDGIGCPICLSARAGLKRHAGDCTIYSALLNGNAWDGVCTCGYGWELVRKSDYSEMLSGERTGALMQAMSIDPNKPSQWAVEGVKPEES